MHQAKPKFKPVKLKEGVWKIVGANDAAKADTRRNRRAFKRAWAKFSRKVNG